MMTKTAQRCRRHLTDSAKSAATKMKRAASRHERRVAKQVIAGGGDASRPVTPPLTEWGVD